MKALTPVFLAVAALSLAAAPAAQAPTGFPFTDEDLNYSINWPGGANLGEAHLHARHSGANWKFELSLDAGVPGFAVKDSYRSESVPDFCSTSFERSTSHGSRTVGERETIDRERAIATRQTLSKEGGKSDLPVPACVKDALAYLFYSRVEMGQGRVPAAQDILFGGLSRIQVDYTGAPIITVNQKQVQSDQVTCTFKGKTGDYSFDIYFARDAARTPLLVTAPFAMGKFSMELIH
ncbi:MAG TPA: DUF3108 domain-containing protein [Candidatus Acidoferrales bacterium]|nr:DUF3108 domain-containing protein [Candidatus Acidoferrales bacterium]